MSRLPGGSLRGRSLGEAQVKALAATLSMLYGAVLLAASAAVPRRPGHEQDLIAHIHSWTPEAQAQAIGAVGVVMNRGLAWLTDSANRGCQRVAVTLGCHAMGSRFHAAEHTAEVVLAHDVALLGRFAAGP